VVESIFRESKVYHVQTFVFENTANGLTSREEAILKYKIVYLSDRIANLFPVEPIPYDIYMRVHVSSMIKSRIFCEILKYSFPQDQRLSEIDEQ
jgi:hypothetical protein